METASANPSPLDPLNRGHNHPLTTKVTFKTMASCPMCLALNQKSRELVREGAPILKKMLCSNPYYKERENDDEFWMNFILSQGAAVRDLVEASKAHTTREGN